MEHDLGRFNSLISARYIPQEPSLLDEMVESEDIKYNYREPKLR